MQREAAGPKCTRALVPKAVLRSVSVCDCLLQSLLRLLQAFFIWASVLGQVP